MKLKFAFFLIIASLVTSCKKEAPAPLPTADFYVGNAECLSPCYLYFYNQSSNAVSYSWDFDNNTGSNSENDSSLFFNLGVYNIELIVSNADGIKDSVTKTVTVY